MEDTREADLAVDSTGAIWVAWHGYTSMGGGIHYQTSTDNGLTWSAPVFLHSGYSPSIAASSDGLAVAWYQNECFEDPLRYCTANIWYTTSADDGASWAAPTRYTHYRGSDWTPSVAGLGDGGFALAWTSQRRRSSPQYTVDTTVWFGKPGVHEDLSPPPYVARLEHMPVANPQEGEEVTVLAWLADESAGVTSTVGWSSDAVEQTPVPMFDDGEHGDFGVGDGVFGGSLGSFSSGTHVVYCVQAGDSAGNVMTSYSRSFVVQPQWVRLNDVLLVVDARYANRVIEHAPVYRDALNSLCVSHDFWDTSLLGPPDTDELAMYVDGLAVWSVPEWDGWLIDELTRE